MTTRPLPGLQAAAIALLVVGLLAALNYLANHVVRLPGGRLGYVLVVTFAAGMVVPTLALGRLAALGVLERRLPWRGWPEAGAVGGALLVAALIAAFPIGGDVLDAPGRALHLFVWLSLSSLAEVLVFAGLLHGVVEVLAARWLPRWLAIGLAALVASVTFGVYHLTYYAPWNTWAVAGKLTIVWLEVTTVYVVTRSVWAAAAFTTVMAVIGFILNDVRRLDGEPLALGVVLAVVTFAAVVLIARRSGPAAAAAVRQAGADGLAAPGGAR
jgi:hypothetical protein